MFTYDKESIIKKMLSNKIVLVIRGYDTDTVINIVECVVSAGIYNIEITMDSPNAKKTIKKLIEKFGEKAIIGAGTVLSVGDTLDAIKAGAKYIVSPIDLTEMIPVTEKFGAVSMIGGVTPSEIFRNSKAGADFVKFFPASKFGSGYIKDVLGPLDEINFYISGGVKYDNIEEFIKAGVKLIGVGSAILDNEAIKNDNWNEIYNRAKKISEFGME